MSNDFHHEDRPLTQAEQDANEISLIVEAVKETHGDQPVELIVQALLYRFKHARTEPRIADTTVVEWAVKIKEGTL